MKLITLLLLFSTHAWSANWEYSVSDAAKKKLAKTYPFIGNSCMVSAYFFSSVFSDKGAFQLSFLKGVDQLTKGTELLDLVEENLKLKVESQGLTPEELLRFDKSIRKKTQLKKIIISRELSDKKGSALIAKIGASVKASLKKGFAPIFSFVKYTKDKKSKVDGHSVVMTSLKKSKEGLKFDFVDLKDQYYVSTVERRSIKLRFLGKKMKVKVFKKDAREHPPVSIERMDPFLVSTDLSKGDVYYLHGLIVAD